MTDLRIIEVFGQYQELVALKPQSDLDKNDPIVREKFDNFCQYMLNAFAGEPHNEKIVSDAFDSISSVVHDDTQDVDVAFLSKLESGALPLVMIRLIFAKHKMRPKISYPKLANWDRLIQDYITSVPYHTKNTVGEYYDF